MKSLVLAEKPSVAKEIARVLGCTQKHKSYIEGPKYVVTWALGHLVTLAEPEDYDKKYRTWTLEDLPIVPKRMNLKVMRETSHQFKAIAQLCKRQDISELIIATDAGREGELVARWIMELVHWRKPFKRLWISSQTDQAIKEGFQKLKDGRAYNDLYASAVCRAEADWLIGLNVTRALTTKYNAQLAAGRVQTPTLSMLMEREKAIKNFQSQPYWTITAQFDRFQATYRQQDTQDGRIWSEEEAKEIVKRIADNSQVATVVQLRTTEKQQPHPQAYDLTELQRDANKKLGFSAKQTSNVLQKLYEQHKLVTYPRTDSKYLTTDMVPTLPGRLQSIAVGPYQTLARKALAGKVTMSARVVNNEKVSDHHAIIPTEQFVQLGQLTNDERRLYDLIVRRFLSLFFKPYRYDETAVVIQAGNDKLYAKGKIEKDAGWRAVYTENSRELDREDEEEDGQENTSSLEQQSLPPLKQGEKLKIKQTMYKPLRTMPPARYTEASLLAQMEKYGLGTPATRADIIEKLLQTDTIDRTSNRLQPTGKGEQLIELVVDELRSPELTAKWEAELEKIAKGKADPEKFIVAIRQQATKWVGEVISTTKQYKPHNTTGSFCPECGEAMLEVKGKRGKSFVCSNRECSYRKAAGPVLLNKRCPQCRKKMEMHDGKAGKYAQCKPCNIIEMLDEAKSGKINKREEQKLLNKYKDNAPLTNSLAYKLKAAMMEQNKK
ncbi:DNA topoisomerase III [Paenibacillus yanchengensis]|uniref:DNA topoisomerase n=1 Tax=Paenibacillus yanchengensis TaxID=2035833 RepID=A0ABW4YPN4_9BACL